MAEEVKEEVKFQSRFSPKSTVAQGMRMKEYLDFLVENGDEVVADTVAKIIAFSKANCPTCVKDLPPRKVSVTKQLNSLSEEDQAIIKAKIAELAAKE